MSDATLRQVKHVIAGVLFEVDDTPPDFILESFTPDDAVTAIMQLIAEQTAAAERKHEQECLEIIKQRDRAEDWADKLAYAIAPLEIIGEHSSNNNPWYNALEIAETATKPTPEAGDE
jgi:hypothetical protein